MKKCCHCVGLLVCCLFFFSPCCHVGISLCVNGGGWSLFFWHQKISVVVSLGQNWWWMVSTWLHVNVVPIVMGPLCFTVQQSEEIKSQNLTSTKNCFGKMKDEIFMSIIFMFLVSLFCLICLVVRVIQTKRKLFKSAS